MHRWPARYEFYVGMPKTWKNGGGKGPNMSIPLRKKGPHTPRLACYDMYVVRGSSSVKTYAKKKIRLSRVKHLSSRTHNTKYNDM